jgi:hypothetical protein
MFCELFCFIEQKYRTRPYCKVNLFTASFKIRGHSVYHLTSHKHKAVSDILMHRQG